MAIMAHKSAIARHIAVIIEALARERKLKPACRDAGVSYGVVRRWVTGERDPKLSDVESFLNTRGMTLVFMDLDTPPK